MHSSAELTDVVDDTEIKPFEVGELLTDVDDAIVTAWELPAFNSSGQPMSRAVSPVEDTAMHMDQYRQSREAGFEAGFAAGQQEAAAAIEAACTALASSQAQVLGQVVEHCDAVAELATALAVELATSILGREIAVSTDFAQLAAAKALKAAAASETINITLHPVDAETIGDIEGINVTTDPNMPRAAATAHVGEGILDLSVDAALSRVRTELDLPAATTTVSQTVSSTPAKTTAKKTTARKTTAAKKAPAKRAAPAKKASAKKP